MYHAAIQVHHGTLFAWFELTVTEKATVSKKTTSNNHRCQYVPSHDILDMKKRRKYSHGLEISYCPHGVQMVLKDLTRKT